MDRVMFEPDSDAPLDDHAGHDLRVMMLGAFQFARRWQRPGAPGGSQRLIAFLALRDRTVSRSVTAGTLWPEAHAHGALRSALSRLEAIPRCAVHVDTVDLKLTSEVSVDIRNARALANRLLVVGGVQAAADTTAAAVTALSTDLLPDWYDWYDDWAILESEEWRQLRLHALDALANRLKTDGRFSDAIGAALAAVRGEPLRETANATLIHIHLEEGNPSEALAAFERYRILLRDELGLDPSPLLLQLMEDLLNPRG